MTGAVAPWREDFEAIGYRRYFDSFKGRHDKHLPLEEQMYQGTWQKRITDQIGIRYFVGFDLYQWPEGRRSINAHVQFSVKDEHEVTCNVSRSVTSIEEGETFFASLWQKMGWGYYELEWKTCKQAGYTVADCIFPKCSCNDPLPTQVRRGGDRAESV